ncbi:MAG TPA: hypothetical protein VFW17_13560 [Ktedonobacterales bacterium]|jgi:hypothetical protein|nr:hypothetical protein [Ktedonobacterales bacterium]
MKDWKAELDAYFQRREQHEAQQQPDHDHAQAAEETIAIEEFMATVVVPAFEEFGGILKEHRYHIRLRLGDSNMRIVAEYAGREEFDYTLWVGGNGLSAELRAGGRHTPDSFQNAKGNSAMADTTQEDIAQQLADRFVALATPAFT